MIKLEEAYQLLVEQTTQLKKDIVRYFSLKKIVCLPGPHDGKELAEFWNLEKKLSQIIEEDSK